MTSIQNVSANLDAFKEKLAGFAPRDTPINVIFPHYLIDAAKSESFAKKQGRLMDPALKMQSYAVGPPRQDTKFQKQANKGSSLMSSDADDVMNMMVEYSL